MDTFLLVNEDNLSIDRLKFASNNLWSTNLVWTARPSIQICPTDEGYKVGLCWNFFTLTPKGTWFVSVVCVDAIVCEYDLLIEEVALLTPPLSTEQTSCQKYHSQTPSTLHCVDEGVEYQLKRSLDETTAVYELIHIAPDDCPFLFSISLKSMMFATARVLLAFNDTPT